MSFKNQKLLAEAKTARAEYMRGEITLEEARAKIAPYEAKFNEVSAKVAKRFGVKPQKFNRTAFLR